MVIVTRNFGAFAAPQRLGTSAQACETNICRATFRVKISSRICLTTWVDLVERINNQLFNSEDH